MIIVDTVFGEFCFKGVGTYCLYPHNDKQMGFSLVLNPIAGMCKYIKRK